MNLPMPDLCLFCLEELKESERCPNVVGCGCEVKCHISCLQAWFQQKEQMECPICHHVSVMNPIQPPREYVIVHVQALRNEDQIQRIQFREKCAGCCCLTLLVWWIGGIILQYAF
jgi:hypothetical protein